MMDLINNSIKKLNLSNKDMDIIKTIILAISLYYLMDKGYPLFKKIIYEFFS